MYGDISLIKLKNWRISYKDQKCLAYADDKMLVFSKLSSISFEEILDISTSGNDYNKYIELYDAVPKKIKNESVLYIVLNKQFDFISMVKPSKDSFPFPKCKHIELSINNSDKNDALANMKEFVALIHK